MFWLAVKDLQLKFLLAGSPMFAVYAHYGNLIEVPEQQPSLGSGPWGVRPLSPMICTNDGRVNVAFRSYNLTGC